MNLHPWHLQQGACVCCKSLFEYHEKKSSKFVSEANRENLRECSADTYRQSNGWGDVSQCTAPEKKPLTNIIVR